LVIEGNHHRGSATKVGNGMKILKISFKMLKAEEMERTITSSCEIIDEKDWK